MLGLAAADDTMAVVNQAATKKKAKPLQLATDMSSSQGIDIDDIEEKMIQAMGMAMDDSYDDELEDYNKNSLEGKGATNNPWKIDYNEWATIQSWVENECCKLNTPLESALDPLVKWAKGWANSSENVDSKDWEEVFVDRLRAIQLEQDKTRLEQGMAMSGGKPMSSLAIAASGSVNSVDRSDLFKPPVGSQKQGRAAKETMRQKLARAVTVAKARNQNNPPAQT